MKKTTLVIHIYIRIDTYVSSKVNVLGIWSPITSSSIGLSKKRFEVEKRDSIESV